MGESRQMACSVALRLARLTLGLPQAPKNSLRGARGKHNFLLPVSSSADSSWPRVGETAFSLTHVTLLGFYTLRAYTPRMALCAIDKHVATHISGQKVVSCTYTFKVQASALIHRADSTAYIM